MTETSLAGRTAIVTGAGGGLGRAEALALAAAGANVVVNDYSAAGDEVVAEIKAAGGEAIAVRGDIGEWDLGEHLVAAALDTWGSHDIVVNTDRVLRVKIIFSLTESDWAVVYRVHHTGNPYLSR